MDDLGGTPEDLLRMFYDHIDRSQSCSDAFDRFDKSIRAYLIKALVFRFAYLLSASSPLLGRALRERAELLAADTLIAVWKMAGEPRTKQKGINEHRWDPDRNASVLTWMVTIALGVSELVCCARESLV